VRFPEQTALLRLVTEVKADPRQVDRWSAAIDSGASPATLLASGFKEIHYVLELAPRCLWLVGPGPLDPAAHVWKVDVDGLTARFDRSSNVPLPA
jgi:hypothetical protein